MVRASVYTYSLYVPVEELSQENDCVCHRVKDNTNQRERRMDRGRQSEVCEGVCICCKFTWGLQCCEAFCLWNAVKYTVTDVFVNRGIQIKLDWSQLEGRRSLWKLRNVILLQPGVLPPCWFHTWSIREFESLWRDSVFKWKFKSFYSFYIIFWSTQWDVGHRISKTSPQMSPL